jgi:tRNA uridine 5-carboxymethylaminomethyl modification enzyme
MQRSFEVIVIGGGHAGVEAAAAAARLGAATLLITPVLEGLGQMSCNPALGGIAKGTVVREVDALGGVMARAADRARIHFRMLNRSKGPAVWSPRVQCDRALYPRGVRSLLEELPSLRFHQGRVDSLLMREGRVEGVRTEAGEEILAPSVVLTAGTFLRGRIHVGHAPGVAGGRAGEAPSVSLAEQLEAQGLTVGRFKTGTPPRVDGRSVDFSRLEEQPGEEPSMRLSIWEERALLPQRSCWITWTGEPLADLVESHLGDSALYGGEIAGQGPRYCPSIEDKIVKFPQLRRHQVFLEPEGLDTSEMYVNGLSTSLPAEVQLGMLRSVPGMERAEMTRVGYAIEYDFYPPHQLQPTLESKAVGGLFLAGQVNGTTGYEEAAGQGLVAGANAVLMPRQSEPLLLGRDEAFIGVLVDDLVTRGTDEPYRLFTSRAEYRLLLRQDNAWERLGSRARSVGLLSEEQSVRLERRMEEWERLREWAAETRITPGTANPLLQGQGQAPLTETVRLGSLLKRPHVEVRAVAEAAGAEPPSAGELLDALQMELRYEGYLAKERQRAERMRGQGAFALPSDLPYMELLSLSTEARQKLDRIRPSDLSQAGRIPGVSPSDLQNLMMEVRKRRTTAAAS